MKTKTLTLLMFVVFILNAVSNAFGRMDKLHEDLPVEYNDTNFELIRSDDNINIYSRWIPADAERKTRQLKVEFTIEASSESILSVLYDETSYTYWMQSTKSYYRLKTIDARNWYVYIQFSIPWPLNNQDCILKYEVNEIPEQFKTIITLTGVPDYLQTYHGIERISHMEGCWIITQKGENKTHVEYFIYSKQAPKFPTWITDPLIQKNLIKTMKAFKDVVLTANYNNKAT